jgi:4-hydroxy-2-oxoheptanedioate aldolase
MSAVANRILQAKKDGSATFGAWQSLGNNVAAENLARQGFDWIVIDTQHGSVEWEQVAGIMQAIENGGVGAVLRVGWNDPRLIMRALDLGAHGVIVPMISTVADAVRARDAARYPPLGNRSFGPIRRYYSVDASQSEAACLLMIETAEGLDNVEAIAATPGIDGLYIGPVDLSLSLGLPLSLTLDARVLAGIDRVVAACARHGIIAGCASFSSTSASTLLERGVKLITLGSDLGFMLSGARSDIDFIKQFRGGESEQRVRN